MLHLSFKMEYSGSWEVPGACGHGFGEHRSPLCVWRREGLRVLEVGSLDVKVWGFKVPG